MLLSDLRKKFVKRSGRYDLIDENGADNGADHFINAGQDLLDMLQDTPKCIRSHAIQTSAGSYTIELMRCIAVREVWMQSATVERYQLKEVERDWLKRYYSKPISEITNGVPAYWSYNVIGMSPEQIGMDSDDFTGFYGMGDKHFGNDWEYDGLIYMAPADGIYTVEIIAKFFSPALEDDNSSSYWLTRFPEILLKAALAQHETSLGNSERFNDYLAALRLDLKIVDYILVEQDMNINEMGG